MTLTKIESKLRQFAPRTLLVRIFLLLSLVILTTIGIWTALLGYTEREPRAQQLAQLTVSAVNITHAALIAAAPEKRRYLLLDLSEREGIHIMPAEDDDKIEFLPDDLFNHRFAQETRRMLGTGTLLAQSVNGQKGVWASFQLDDDIEDIYWVMLPPEHAPGFGWHWLGWGAASLALALLAAWWIVSSVTRPLRALGRAARQVGKGHRPEPIAVCGAEELTQLATAFNQMSENLSCMERDRAEVLAGISHDLRTPLTRLRLEAEMSVSDDAAREAIIGDIEQMDAIIGQFLNYARSAGDELPLDTDIEQLLQDVAARFVRSGIRLQVDCPLLPTMSVRQQALSRAIGNLIENARKYGGGDVTLRAWAETSTSAQNLVIEVMDRGPGIPEMETERIKQPFTRLESARTDVKGTGLGLAIVDRIAHLHGGRLDLLPREDGGLIAALRLPR